jgi:hypothetical protein
MRSRTALLLSLALFLPLIALADPASDLFSALNTAATHQDVQQPAPPAATSSPSVLDPSAIKTLQDEIAYLQKALSDFAAAKSATPQPHTTTPSIVSITRALVLGMRGDDPLTNDSTGGSITFLGQGANPAVLNVYNNTVWQGSTGPANVRPTAFAIQNGSPFEPPHSGVVRLQISTRVPIRSRTSTSEAVHRISTARMAECLARSWTKPRTAAAVATTAALENASWLQRLAMHMWYTQPMTTADTKRIEKIARESAALARKTLKKTNELEAY